MSDSAKGFTLAEFFIAIAIFSFIALSLMYSLNVAVKAYRQESSLEDFHSVSSVLYSVMERDLSSAAAFSGIYLIGSASMLYFYSPSPFPGSGYPVSRISYSVQEGPSNQATVTRRAENPFAQEDQQERAAAYTVLYPLGMNFSGVRLQYFSFVSDEEDPFPKAASGWLENWEKPFFPDAVRISFQATGESSSLFSTRTIFLPQGLGPKPRKVED